MVVRSIFRRFCQTKNVARKYEVVAPGCVTARRPFRSLPKNISVPPYAESGHPAVIECAEIKSKGDVEKMKTACKLAKRVLDKAGELARPGTTTQDIDDLVFEMTTRNGAYPSPLNYKGFPKSVCTSVNNCACHGIPDDRPLQDGDIINIDVTVYLDGYHGDCSKTYEVGSGVDADGKRLIAVTEECLDIGMGACGPGKLFGDIGFRIEAHARENGFNVIPCFAGHGIGSYFHGPPDIFHVGNSYPGAMKPGLTFTIEPILSEGTEQVGILDDDWTALTLDHSRSAQCEHTLLITETGFEVLTA